MPGDVTEYFLMLPQQGKTRTRLNAWLEPVEDAVRISMELDSTEMMKRFVMAGLGVAFVAASNCREEIAAGIFLYSLERPDLQNPSLIFPPSVAGPGRPNATR